MNRLKSVTEPYGTKEEYTFDGQGNIQTKTMTHPDGYEYTFKQNGKEYTLDDVATHEITYSYDANNRLKFEGEYIGGSGEEYEGFIEITRYSEYDNNGNMIKRTRGGQVDEETETFEYNELNQLTKYTNPYGEETTYKYSPDGMRTSKINNGVETKYYWDRGYISAESVNDEYTASNYIGATGIFAREEAENTDYMLKNGHGDVTSLVSEGMESIDYNYTAYGEEKWKTEGDSNPFRYSGEYVDEESGLIYLRNRYYDPSIGRFINEDPVKDGLNWYAYCGNNPIKFVDPSGESAIVVLTIIGGALIGALISGGTNAVVQGSIDGWENINWGEVGINAVGGAVSGAFGASGLNLAWVVGINAAVGAGTYAGTEWVNGETPSFSGVLLNAGLGAAIGAIGGSNSAYIKDLKATELAYNFSKFLGLQTGQEINKQALFQMSIRQGGKNILFGIRDELLNYLGSSIFGMGSSGGNVEYLQSILGVEQDGIFGQNTKNALMELQLKLGVTADGIYGPETANALSNLFN